MVPYYQDDLVTIYHGDSLEILPWLAFDCIFTDPPYGIDLNTDFKTRGQSNQAKCHDYKAVAGDKEPFNPAWLLAFDKPTVLWGANYFADKLPTSSGWLVWDKQRPLTADQSQCELAWTNFVKGVRVFSFRWNGMVQQGTRQVAHETRWHPTQKPVELLTWLLSLSWTPKEGIIADPYMGSGSMLVAASRANRKSIGIETEEAYCESAANRFRKGSWMKTVQGGIFG